MLVEILFEKLIHVHRLQPRFGSPNIGQTVQSFIIDRVITFQWQLRC